MAQQAKETLGTKELTVLATRGNFGGEEILKCDAPPTTRPVGARRMRGRPAFDD